MTTSTKDRRTSRRSYVPNSALAKSIEFTEDMMNVSLTDGRIVSVPIIWSPRLHAATPEQRKAYEIGAGGRGLHWEEIDEDLSVAGLLAGPDRRSDRSTQISSESTLMDPGVKVVNLRADPSVRFASAENFGAGPIDYGVNPVEITVNPADFGFKRKTGWTKRKTSG